jgi:ribonuclease III
MGGRQLSDDELVAAIAAITGVEVKDRNRLRAALTHASARKGSATDYQRLEFLGDRVLGLAVAEMVFADYPDAPEGELSLRLNALVNAEALAGIADEAGIPDLIRTSGEVRARASRNQVNLRSDVVEALIAVVYLEGGMEAARAFVRRYWEPRSKLASAARRGLRESMAIAFRAGGVAGMFNMRSIPPASPGRPPGMTRAIGCTMEDVFHSPHVVRRPFSRRDALS